MSKSSCAKVHMRFMKRGYLASSSIQCESVDKCCVYNNHNVNYGLPLFNDGLAYLASRVYDRLVRNMASSEQESDAKTRRK